MPVSDCKAVVKEKCEILGLGAVRKYGYQLKMRETFGWSGSARPRYPVKF